MKEFVVFYTLENDIKREKIMKEVTVKKEDVFQEVLEKVEKHNFLMIKNEQEDFSINTSQIRYIRVKGEQRYSNQHS